MSNIYPYFAPDNYREKQKYYSCIVTVNNQDVAIEISNAIDRKLRIGSEVGIKDGNIAVFIKPEFDINKAKKIALDVLQKEVYRGKIINQKIHFAAECVYINNTLSNDIFIGGVTYTGINSIELTIIKRFIDLFLKTGLIFLNDPFTVCSVI